MRLRLVFLSLVVLSVASADTLTLRNGRTVQGSYLGGNSRQVRFAVDDRIETFDVNDISTIQFAAGAATAPQSAPQAAPAPPRRTELMRPEQSAPARKAVETTSSGEVPAGTPITIRMIDDVDSQHAQVGQTFRASVDEAVMAGDRAVIPRGADVVVKLVELKDPSKISGGGQLTLDLDSVTINGRPVQVQSQAVTQAGESRKGESAKVIGGTAALGAIIGAIAGGGKGAAIGGISGAGAGTAIQVLTQGTRVRVPSETRLTFTLQQPLRIP